MYAKDLIQQLGTCSYDMLHREGIRLILRNDIYEDICGHVLDCEDLNKWCHELGLKDFEVEHAAIEEPFLILHKDSEEYRYFRVVLAL